MNPAEIVVFIARGIARLAHNHALSGGGIGSERTSTLLDMLATFIEGGGDMYQELKEFAEEIKLLVEQHGEPTRGQWEAMKARHDVAMATIVANKERLLAEIRAEESTGAPTEPPALTGPSPGIGTLVGLAATIQPNNMLENHENGDEGSEEEGEEEEEADPAAPPDAPKKKKKKKKSSR